MRNWYSLFSHTGGETEALWNEFHFGENQNLLRLQRAVTTNMEYEGMLRGIYAVKLPTGKGVNEWLMDDANILPNSIITLNGYMRILPSEVINHLHSRGCEIYNIHPAPIQLYPDLRGKDPQERMYTGIKEGKYGFIGVVIHAVDPGVDTGEVKHWLLELADPSLTKEELYQHLHDMGTRAWIEFLKEVSSGENS